MTQKILVVEDDRRIATALAIRLQSAGYEVMVAPDAVLAMSLALKHRPDLLVLDILIPGGNGFQVAEWLQSLDAMISVPYIFITASKVPGLRERARSLGGVGFFEKPYDAGELLTIIREALEPPDGYWSIRESTIRTWNI